MNTKLSRNSCFLLQRLLGLRLLLSCILKSFFDDWCNLPRQLYCSFEGLEDQVAARSGASGPAWNSASWFVALPNCQLATKETFSYLKVSGWAGPAGPGVSQWQLLIVIYYRAA